MLLASALMFLLADPTGAVEIDPVCVSRPIDCRTVLPFELRIGDEVFPVDLQSTRPWISDGRLTLYPGESVVLNIDDADKPVVESWFVADTVISDERAAVMDGMFASDGAFEGVEGPAGQLLGEPLANQPAKRLRLTFRQAPDSESMFLVVENQYAGTLSYDAGMLHTGGEGLTWSATTVCTVQPVIFNMEHWPHPIMALSLGGFAIAPDVSDEMVCR